MEKRLSPTKPSDLNPANLLTLLRLVLVPVFAVCLLEGRWLPAFVAFGVASLTDWLDGWLARRYGWVTALGVFIDPLADKALQLTAFTLLAAKDHCPDWMAVLAWSRELLVVAGFALLALVAQLRAVKPSWLGKSGTMAQMCGLAMLLGLRAFGRAEIYESQVLLVLSAAVWLNFASGLEYAVKGFKAYEALQPRSKRRGGNRLG